MRRPPLIDRSFTARAFEILKRFPSCRILVVGDIMLDEYVWGDVGRISPEAPVPVVAVTRDTRALGGAGNVAVNLSGLGAGVVLAGLIGADPPGREIVRMLKAHRIGISGIVIDRNRPTTTKKRVVAHSQQVVLGGRELSGDTEIMEGGKALLRKSNARAILITRGKEGMSLVERGRKAFFHIPAQARQGFGALRGP